jgi:hypothetical protein
MIQMGAYWLYALLIVSKHHFCNLQQAQEKDL